MTRKSNWALPTDAALASASPTEGVRELSSARINRQASKSHNRERLIKTALFLITSLSFLHIRFLGDLYISELILALVLILHLPQKRRQPLPPRILLLVSLLALWLCGQALTDLYRESTFLDYSRGWARIIFTGFNLLGLYLMIRNEVKRMTVAFLGLIVAQLLGYLTMPIPYAQGDPWKFGLAYPLTTLVALLSSTWTISKRRCGPVVLLGPMALLNLLLGARSLAAVCLISGLYTLIASRRSVNGLVPHQIPPAVVALLGGLFALGGAYMYGSLAESGRLGVTAQLKYQIQSSGRFSFILGGRNEIVFSSLAIRRSPIIGYGSFTRFPPDIQSAGGARLEEWGYQYVPPTDERGDRLPTHSAVFGMWVESGIAALPFWISCLILAWSGCVRAIQRGGPLASLRIFMAVLMIWDIIFSPFGADRRITVPLVLLLLTGDRLWQLTSPSSAS